MTPSAPDSGDPRDLAASDLDGWIRAAQEGSRDALEKVVTAVQGNVYGLALRFLWHPQDAEDAAQEVLVRVVTRLSSFRSESSFETWVYRVAVNTLLNIRRGRMEEAGYTFVSFGADLEEWPAVESLTGAPDPDREILLEEVRVGCTLGMLLCLDRPLRLAYILGEIFDLDHREAAAVLEISPAAYRQRRSRARRAIVDFMQGKCGLVNPANRCRCRKRLPLAVERGRVDPARLLHAGSAPSARRFPETLATIRSLEAGQRAVAVYRAQSEPTVPAALTRFVQAILGDPVET